MKRSFAVLLAMLLLLLAGSALADAVRPVGGLLTFDLPTQEEAFSLLNSYGSTTLKTTGTTVTGQRVAFEIGGTVGTGYHYCLSVRPDWTTTFQAVYDSDSPSFSYDFYMPGEYIVFVTNAGGSMVGYSDAVFITGTDLVQQKVNELVAACPAGDDYTRALWLHDWLTTHAYYDSTLAYHGADILLRGYGVCQSFSEAYRKLLMAAGIACDIVPANMMGHEWNAARLNGEWTMIDTTWDAYGYAPAGSGAPSSECSHIYFGLNNELMRYDHFAYTDSTTAGLLSDACVSLANNYYVRKNYAPGWMAACSFDDLINAQLNNHAASFSLMMINADFRGDLKALGRDDVAAAAAAECLNGTERDNAYGERCTLTAAHTPDSYSSMSCTIQLNAAYYSAFVVADPHWSMSDDGKSCFIEKPVITGGAAPYTIAYNIYDADSNPVNYFYSSDPYVAATCPYNGTFNVFVVVTDSAGASQTVMTGWFTVSSYDGTLTVDDPFWELSPDGRSCFIQKPAVSGGTAPYTFAYNIYDAVGNPINYFYSSDKYVAATCPYNDLFNVYVVVSDAAGAQQIVMTGWFTVNTWPELSFSDPEWTISDDECALIIHRPQVSGATGPCSYIYTVRDATGAIAARYDTTAEALTIPLPADGEYSATVTVSDDRAIGITPPIRFFINGYTHRYRITMSGESSLGMLFVIETPSDAAMIVLDGPDFSIQYTRGSMPSESGRQWNVYLHPPVAYPIVVSFSRDGSTWIRLTHLTEGVSSTAASRSVPEEEIEEDFEDILPPEEEEPCTEDDLFIPEEVIPVIPIMEELPVEAA